MLDTPKFDLSAEISASTFLEEYALLILKIMDQVHQSRDGPDV